MPASATIQISFKNGYLVYENVVSDSDTRLKRAKVEDGQRFTLWRHFQALARKSDATYCTQHDCRLPMPNGISKAQPAAFNTRHDFFEMVQL